MTKKLTDRAASFSSKEEGKRLKKHEKKQEKRDRENVEAEEHEKTLAKKQKHSNHDNEEMTQRQGQAQQDATTTTTNPMTEKSVNAEKTWKVTSPNLIKPVMFPHRYILAPMVGASELAFRLLCRKYGTQLAYTPMMSAQKFGTDEEYRRQEFQTCPQDRPLVCHFGANDPDEFAQAAIMAAPFCDAIDLNLGCPQRTAFLGHYGSYLLNAQDRDLICRIVRAGARAVNLPIFCKIRLLDTLQETMELCRNLRDAGCSLIAIHARYRASWERKGPGARDGPALLDQVAEIKKVITDIPIIANGNTVTYQDVQDNLQLTKADGLMSAEGILDNPALFLPRMAEDNPSGNHTDVPSDENQKKLDKLQKKLRKITRVEKKAAENGMNSLNDKDKKRLCKKAKVTQSLQNLQKKTMDSSTLDGGHDDNSLSTLYKNAQDKLILANEYLDLATTYPVKMRSVIFHTRRMCKILLEQYQLMEECLNAESIHDLRRILDKIRLYQRHPDSFVYDTVKAKQEKLALERKRQEEGKRKAYEARMRRKAKREGRVDLDYYLHLGAQVPTQQKVLQLRNMPRLQALELWRREHSQHCLSFHLDAPNGGCSRGRACAFLHVDVLGSNVFEEKDEVAG